MTDEHAEGCTARDFLGMVNQTTAFYTVAAAKAEAKEELTRPPDPWCLYAGGGKSADVWLKWDDSNDAPKSYIGVKYANDSAKSEVRDKWILKLESLKSLQNGWDSYSAAPPCRVAIQNAKAALVHEADRLETSPERVEPSAIGGVGVTFLAGNREVVIEFYNKGTAHALYFRMTRPGTCVPKRSPRIERNTK